MKTFPVLHTTTVLLLSLLLSACGSTPRSDYYMLSAEAQDTVSDTPPGPSIGLGPVVIPEYLRGREIVTNSGPNKLDVRQYQRWGEPLDSGITRVALFNLAVLLDTQAVSVYPWRRDAPPEYAVRLLVTSLTVENGKAMLICEWTLSRPASGDELQRRISRLSEPADAKSAASIAAAYSRLLLALSEDIAAAIKGHRGGA